MADPKTILVVDDDPDIQLSCTVVLEKAGYTVLHASSGAEGRTITDLERPDLVMLDIMMEEPDTGFETARWLGREHPQIPVLMLSSIADAAERLFDTGTLKLADLVNKPLSPQEMIDKVAKLLSRKETQGNERHGNK